MYKSCFYANKEGSKRISGLWKIISDNCGFHGKRKIESAKIIEFGNHGNKHNCIKVVSKEGGNNNNKVGKLFRTTVVSMTITIMQSAYIPELGNHGNKNNSVKIIVCANTEGSKKDVGFCKIIWDNCGFYGNRTIQPA